MEIRRCINCMEEIKDSVCPYCGYQKDKTKQIAYGLKRNSILHGRYLVGNVLGQGGFGITYIGFDLALELKVAIKEYFPMGYVSRDYTQSNQIVWNTMHDGQNQWKKGSESFLKEARRMAKLDVFPEIVRVRDTFMENQTSYIVMDYVEGETLKSWLLKNGIMKLSDCVQMLSPLMKSLNKVHKRGMIHRDISPDNIMVLPNGEVRLLDLGAAKDLTIESNGTSQLVTKKGFSPSEQYMENGRIGTWTDVYALCATIYYCITGKLVPEAMDRLMGDTLNFDAPLREALSGKAVETLKEGLAIKPEDRIQTVEELEQRLQKAVTTKDNILMTDTYDMNINKSNVLGSEIIRDSIASITFMDTLGGMAENAWDVSEKKDGSVMAWTVPNGDMYDLYIGGNGGVKGNNCEGLFGNYYKVIKIDFNNCFDTSNVTNMYGMFWGCDKLAKLDVSGFDTSNVTYMSDMFAGCKNLTELNVSGFDTSQVTDMSDMFCGCKNLTKLDVSSFDTGQVTNMGYMFAYCENLTKLNVSGFDTGNVTNMYGMFDGCGITAEKAGLKDSMETEKMYYIIC